MGLDVITGEFLDVSLPNKFYDVVTMIDVVEHLKSPLESLCKARRLLKPKGIVALLTGDVDSFLARLTRSHWRLMTPPLHLYFFSRETLTKTLKKAGFDILKIMWPGKFVSINLMLYQFFNLYFSRKSFIANQIKNRKFLHDLDVYLNLKDEIFVIAQKIE